MSLVHTARTVQGNSTLPRRESIGGHLAVDVDVTQIPAWAASSRGVIANTTSSNGVLQRCGSTTCVPGTCDHSEEGPKLARRSRGAGDSTVPQVVHEVIGTPGRPLASAARWSMESRLGYDFSAVRVHTDAKAAASARAVHADAYTVGHHVVSATADIDAGTGPGQHLLAHELTHVVQQQHSVGTQPVAVSRPDDPSEMEAESVARAVDDGGSVIQRPTAPTLARFTHDDCSEDDLRAHVWPADYIARQMTSKAIRVLTAAGTTPPAAGSPLETLFGKYFQTSTPSLGSILAVYDKIDVEFRANDYQYECDEDCGDSELGRVYAIWSDIHLCMNHLRGWANDCIARTIVHEFAHYYGGLSSDPAYCKSGCAYTRCPASLSVADALVNPDSYACLAYELYPMAL